MENSASPVKEIPEAQPQVFINFRGKEVRRNFVSHLVTALKKDGLKIYIDEEELRSEPIDILFTRIDQSKIALAIFSKKYGDSNWCLDELGKIMRNVEKNDIRIIPIFFNVTPNDVKWQLGKFGMNLYQGDRYDLPEMVQWRKDLNSAGKIMGMWSFMYRNDSIFVDAIIVEVNKVIAIISSESRGGTNTLTSSGASSSITNEHIRASLPPYGLDQRLKRLEEKLDFSSSVTQIVGIVGMAGIGKTALAQMHFNKWNNMYLVNKILYGIREKSKPKPEPKLKLKLEPKRERELEPDREPNPERKAEPKPEKELEPELEREQEPKPELEPKPKPKPEREETEEGKLSWLEMELLGSKNDKSKAAIFKKKSFLVLDDVSEKEQIQFLLNNLSRIKKGSKIVITTRDQLWIKDGDRFFTDIYMVPGLNDKEALQLFSYYAFNDPNYVPTENISKLSNKFVEYAGGNPRALEELGRELFNKEEDHWRTELKELPRCCNEQIRKGFRITYDELTNDQKDIFLDIACFFRSEDEDYVTTLLASNVSSGEAVRSVRYLTDKFMISVSAGQIEMPDLLCSLGKELGLLTTQGKELVTSRLWEHDKAIGALFKEEGTKSVRGILLDVSKLASGIAMDEEAFTMMPNLRYLKIFDSRCPRQCEVVNCKVHLPEGLHFPLKEIRYFHWLKFPLEELPPDFNPENLVDLRLPYSKTQRIWSDNKDTPYLTWVDLSHSTKLIDLSALSNAGSLRRLNLEGCTMLVKLPVGMNNMKSLDFLNLRGCTSLLSLPGNINLISLRTLILSDCSNFRDFQVISNTLERLHLERTAIETLPHTIGNLQRLIVLNLKNCEMLESLPLCLDNLKALEELILSGCSRLTRFPEMKENLENLQILLLDRTSIEEVPKILNLQRSPPVIGLSMLRRLCLSRNDMIRSLQPSLSELYHLKWIDLKYCKNLQSISTLPPNLRCLDAHACTSLKTVASPLALLMPTQQVPSSFIFTNCENLEHVAKNEITCYGHHKGWHLSETLNRQNKGLAFEALVATCFPGSEVPAWFSHKASGAVIKPELPRHWRESGFVGIALCAIVPFEEHIIQNNNLQVKCICSFNNVKTSFSYFNFPVEGLSEKCDEKRTIKSSHLFIGYTNWLNISKCQEEGCVPSVVSIKFEVTDDTGDVTNCGVLKCGFSLVYASGSWEASLKNDAVKQGEDESLKLNKEVPKTKIANGCQTTLLDHKVNGEVHC